MPSINDYRWRQWRSLSLKIERIPSLKPIEPKRNLQWRAMSWRSGKRIEIEKKKTNKFMFWFSWERERKKWKVDNKIKMNSGLIHNLRPFKLKIKHTPSVLGDRYMYLTIFKIVGSTYSFFCPYNFNDRWSFMNSSYIIHTPGFLFLTFFI